MSMAKLAHRFMGVALAQLSDLVGHICGSERYDRDIVGVVGHDATASSPGGDRLALPCNWLVTTVGHDSGVAEDAGVGDPHVCACRTADLVGFLVTVPDGMIPCCQLPSSLVAWLSAHSKCPLGMW